MEREKLLRQARPVTSMHTTTALIKFTTSLCCNELAIQDDDGNYTPIPLKMTSLSPHNF